MWAARPEQCLSILLHLASRGGLHHPVLAHAKGCNTTASNSIRSKQTNSRHAATDRSGEHAREHAGSSTSSDVETACDPEGASEGGNFLEGVARICVGCRRIGGRSNAARSNVLGVSESYSSRVLGLWLRYLGRIRHSTNGRGRENERKQVPEIQNLFLLT